MAGARADTDVVDVDGGGDTSGGGAARAVRVAVWGCGHGELDRVYDVVRRLNADAADGREIELLICCGDFQAVRNEDDLECMACPAKYRQMGTFYRYYTGEAVAPVTTVFVGGNHEAANHLQELFYGGWVAPRIFYLGSSGVFTFRGLRVAGVSGIYKRYNFNEGYYERAPYTGDTMRSVFHVREFDYVKLSLLRSPVDVMVSHDWPEGVYSHGDTQALLRKKPFFAAEVEGDALGNPASRQLLASMRPRFWFAGHLHVKFAAVVQHAPPAAPAAAECAAAAAAAAAPPPTTRFLALDKCLPGRDYLQVVDVPVRAGSDGSDAGAIAGREAGAGGRLCYDPEWLAITAATHPLLPATQRYPPLPRLQPPAPSALAAVAAHMEATAASRGVAAAPWCVPENFVVTAPAYRPGGGGGGARGRARMPARQGNPQTDAFLALLGLPHVVTQAAAAGGGAGGGSRPVAPPPWTATIQAMAIGGRPGGGGAPQAAGAALLPPGPSRMLPTQVVVGRSRWDAAGAVNTGGVATGAADASPPVLQPEDVVAADPDEIALDGAIDEQPSAAAPPADGGDNSCIRDDAEIDI